jgi:CcmD family protein
MTTRKTVWGRTARVVVLVTALGVAAPLAAAAAQGTPSPQTPAAQQQNEFVPISQLPPAEQLPAAPLLIAAYAVAWVALLGYVWSIWRRLGKVERELAEVARRIDAAQRRA